MKKSLFKAFSSAMAIVTAASVLPLNVLAYSDEYGNTFEWRIEEEGKSYWYENGVRQGTYDDPQGVLGHDDASNTDINRGREIYDSESDGWYWLDSVYNGAKAVNKEVWVPYIYQNEDSWKNNAEELNNNAKLSNDMAEQVKKAIINKEGKWIRYNADGIMVKGWYTVEGDQAEIYPNQVGNKYYYDYQTGLMAKGIVSIDGSLYEFDKVTGVCLGTVQKQEVLYGKNIKQLYYNTDNQLVYKYVTIYDDDGMDVGSISYQGNIATGKTGMYDNYYSEKEEDMILESESVYLGNHTYNSFYFPICNANGKVEKAALSSLSESWKDENGNTTKSIYCRYDLDGVLEVKTTTITEYDSKGHDIYSKTTDEQGGEVTSTIEYKSEYSEDGVLLKRSMFLNGRLSNYDIFESVWVNGKSIAVKTNEYSASGNLERIYDRKLDSQGNIVEILSYNIINNEPNLYSVSRSEYNEKGNFTKEATYDIINGKEVVNRLVIRGENGDYETFYSGERKYYDDNGNAATGDAAMLEYSYGYEYDFSGSDKYISKNFTSDPLTGAKKLNNYTVTYFSSVPAGLGFGDEYTEDNSKMYDGNDKLLYTIKNVYRVAKDYIDIQ